MRRTISLHIHKSSDVKSLDLFRVRATKSDFTSMAAGYKRKHHPFVIWLTFAGLIYSGSALLYGIRLDFNPSAFDLFFVPLVLGFLILCYVSAILILTKKRWVFIVSTLVSLGFVIPSLTQFLPTLANPSDFITYAINLTTVPILIVISVFSILSFLSFKNGLDKKKYLASPISIGGVITLLLIVLVVAGVATGYSNNSHAISDPSSTVKVYILLRANDPSNPAGHYSIQNLTVVLGMNNTVTWVNQDDSVHTVTSDSFNSGLLNSGDSWTYTFTTAGTYPYHCSIHPFMTGIVTVVSLS